MAKGMSPLRLLMRNPSRKTLADGIDGSSSAPDSTGAAAQSRQPLGPITETVRNPLIPVAEQSSGDPSTPRAKAKASSHGPEKFPHLENSEVYATSINVTTDKTASSQSKGKFTWQHRHGATAQNAPKEGPPLLNTPPRPPKASDCSDGTASINQDTSQSLSHNLRGCSTGGGITNTPKTGKSVGGKSSTESENGGSQSQNATPSKTVSRSLKYGQPGSANNSGASGLTNVRSTVSQHVITRPIGNLQAVKGVLPQTSNQNFVEHHFELEEDASFWRDHNVQVIIRTRPLSNSELASQGSNRCLKQESPHAVSWLGQPESRFTFDHVAGETVTQAKLFDVAGLPMVENCMSGYNSCMFAYGQTGSGKTHTMLGDIENLDRSPSENRGMTPRVFEYLFARIRKEQECRRHEHLKFFCKCSFLEIYNEQITDLLEPSSTNLQMREDANKGVYVENLSEVEVQCVQDVIQLLLQGAANRKVAATNMNRESSRSHSVFTCVVESKWENNSMTNSRYGRLHLVDLAGSERQKSSGAEGGRLKEAANINKSLSTLGLVIMILVDVANGKQRHVPYRDSKLTFLLQDSLGGNSKTIMIANVSPSSCCAMETLSTLKFAQRAKFIRNNAVINQDASGDVVALRQRIEELKVEVDRLRRESMLRVSSSRILALENESVGAQRCADKSDASTQDCNVIEGSALESRNVNKSQTVSIANNDKQLRSIEAVLAGALRREQQAEDIAKKLAAEIEQLNRLVRQREEDSQCSKMMLRFREEKIRRLEGVADNVLSAEAFYEDERKNLMDELQLIRGRLDRNPELTRFAMENIRLMEELRRYQEFYDGGERDVLLEEISGLRSQLLDMLDAKVGEEQSITKLLTPQKRALVPEISALERENELLLIEVKSYENELKECRNNLNSCLVANADLSRQVDELQATVKELKNERSQRQEESRELLISLDEDVPERFSSGVSLPDPQALSAADPTTGAIRLGTEELDLQKTHVEEQVLELRNQLKEAQDLIQKLSSEVEEANELSERRKPRENVPCVAEDDAVVRQGLQDRWEKLQEIEMRHSEEITQLQLELDSTEEVLKEERQQRLLADEKIDNLSTQLSSTLSRLEHAEGLAEDGLEEERQQRLLADEKIDELSRQLSATLSQLEQAHGLAEDGLAEERQQRLVAEHKSEELRSQLTAVVSKLEEAHCVVEALEGQQLFSINELENLQSEHAKLLTKMKQQEQGEVEHQKQYHDESTLDDPALSILEKRLLRAKRGKEEAKRMNRQFQEEKASRMALDKEREVTMSEVETQAALAITTLQSEILDLREEVCVALESEATAKLQISHLQKEVETLQQTIRELEDTNRYLSEKSDEYRNMVNEKHAQLQGLEADWESSASRLIDYLADGDKALSEAVREMDEITETKIQEISQMGDKHSVEKRDTAESVDHRIQCVQSMDGETKGKVMFPGDGKTTLLETNNSTLEDGEALIRESEKKSMVAFLMVGELHERIRDLKSAQHRLLQENEEAFSNEAAKYAQTATLRQQLEELRRQYTELQDEHEVVIREREDLRQENQSSSLELDTVNELKEGSIRLEKENQDSCRAIAEKDVENGNLRRQLNENHLQSTLIADRYQVLLAAHEELQREQVTYLEEKASKIEEREEQVRLSERKALAVLVVVQQLVQSRNGLNEKCVGLAKEIEDGCLLLADKQNALEALEEKLELGSHQYKDIADQYQLLAETHVNVQQEYNRLLAEQALRLEEGEALVKLSERKAMAAFVMVNDLLERMKELKSTNARLANQISGAEVTFAEKNNALAALQNELSEYSDAASRHHVLKGAHENLRQEHERLQREYARCLEENALKVKEGEQHVRLSDGKAMALVVVVQQLLGSRDDLKATNVGLAKEIEDGHLLVTEKQTALDTLEQKLQQGTHQYKEIGDQYQLLAETHVNLQEEHNRVIAEQGLRLEEAEALTKLSERKAMAAFVVVEHLSERMKELKTTNACLANQIEEAHVTLADKDNALAALQNDKSEFSDVASRHQILKAAHENLRQEHENLQQEQARYLQAKASKTKEQEEQVRLSERKALAVLVVVQQLVESRNGLKETNVGLEKEIEDARLLLADKQNALEALEEKLEQVSHQYKEIADQYQLLAETHVNLQQVQNRLIAENALRLEEAEALVKLSERKAMAAFVLVEDLLERTKKLKTMNACLANQIEEADVTLAEKDNALAVLQNDKSEFSDVASRHQTLKAAHENLRQEHENLQQEQARYLQAKASKTKEQEEQVRLSERKALAVLVVVQQLVESRNGLKETNVGLEKEIEDARLLLADKQNALEALEEKLEQVSHQYKEIADQYQLLAETHVNLQQVQNRLIAENALRLEEAEALVKLSERKAMAAFVLVEDLFERTKKLKTMNACLANQIEEADVTLAEKDNALAVLQNDKSEFSDVASRHQTLKAAHENLRQEHENLQQEQARYLQAKASKTKEQEEQVRLSKRKALAVLVVVQQLVESRNGLKETNVGLEKEIEDGRLLLADKQNALEALEEKLEQVSHQYKEIADQYQLLAETHVNLQQVQNRLIAENALRLEEAEALVKLSERKAMAAFVLVEDLFERTKKLKTMNACLANQIEEADVTLAEKDNALAVLQNDKSEFSDVASRHQTLKAAHENLRQEHENLQQEQARYLQAKASKTKEQEEQVRLSKRKALAVLVVVQQLVESRNGLKETNVGLEKEIEDGRLLLADKQNALEALEEKLEQVSHQYKEIADQYQLLAETHVNLQQVQNRLIAENALRLEEAEALVKLSERKAMAAFVLVEDLLERTKKLKTMNACLANQIEEADVTLAEKDNALAVLQNDKSEFSDVASRHQVLKEEYDNLRQDYETLVQEHGLTAVDWDRAVKLSEKRVMATLVILRQVLDDKEKLKEEVERREREMEEARVAFKEKSTEFVAVEQKVEQSGYQSAEIAGKHQTLIYAHEVLREQHEKCVKDWELERATLVSEKEQSRRDCLEQEQMVQSLLLEVQGLGMTLKEAELRVSDMLTSVQALTVAKQDLELENSRLVLAAREGETTFSEKELQVTAIRVDLADVQARLVAAELREQSIFERMEELTAAKVEGEIERAVVEHAMQQLSEEKHKLRLYVNYLNLEMEKRETAILENFRRSQEAWEAVEARMVTMEEELARLDKSKSLLERDMASLEAAASGDALDLEEKELECLEMKRQLGTVMVQMREMQTAVDLVTAQFAMEMTNREDDKRRMEEEKRACEMQLRDEIATAELILMSTQGSVKTEVQRLDSSLKQTEYRVSEMLNGVKALTVAVEELELEKRRLVVAASQAEMQCREKEQELVATEGDLAGLRSRLMEAELHEKSLSGQMEELTGAKVRWEVERADAKREIEDMKQEKDRLRFDLAILNAEVEEREKAIFYSFRRGQQALERVETRLTTMDQELGGLETSQRNLENDIALLDSAATISSIVLEGKEHKYLEMQRRVENAEVQLYEMQAAADAVMAQVMLERENWQAEKRKMNVETDAREAELRDEIASADLKLVATEGSLKVAVETVEALGLSMKALEGEVLKLTEDAKISLSKVAEKQLEIDRLRGMSMALKAECTEADDSIAALNQLREQYILAEASWRSKQELLTSKLGELEVSAGRVNREGVSKEGSGVSKNRGQLSQCLPGCSPGSEDQKHFDGTHQHDRQKHDIQLLRANIAEKDRTILSAKKEMQIAIANLKDAELEMDKVHRQNHSLTQIQLENKCLIDSLSLKLKTAQEEVLKRDIKIEGCEAELQKVVGIMSDWETKVTDVEIEWRREKEVLAQELTEAKLVANENKNEAGALLQKFQDGQATLKEAEDLVDALVKANENAKHDALDWKNEKENLGIVQGWWMPERDKLVSKIARLETDMHTQKQDIWIMCKEAANGLLATMDVLFAVDKELYKLKNDHQQDMDHVAVDMKVLKGELVALLYDLEGEVIKSFKDMQTVVCELKSEKDRALKDFAELNVMKEQRIAHSLQTVNSQLEAVENERDKYQTELVVLNKQLEMAQTLADESDIIAAEARQAAERSKSHAEEKEDEARILERSVEELESTVFALESQLDIVKRESERHRVAREALEKELEDLNRQMGLMQVTIDNQDTQTLTEAQGAETSKTELDRIVIEMKNQQIQARQSVESLQQECAEKDVQLRSCKAHIAELMLGAEKQASENQQKLKALEAMVEHLKVEERKVNPPGGSASKSVEKPTVKVKGAGSPFKCIGSGLEKQRSSEIDEELCAAKKRIKELESIAAARQKEVFMLNTKLAEAESMTHDVVRDLLGVKMDIASYATLLNQQQVQRIAERARRRTAEAQQKEDELDSLRDRLNEFIEERESWLEEINRRQAEAVAARVSAEKLRLRDETLTAENDKFREECHALRKRVADLEDEIKKLSGQQNLQQRIHHHAKIKEENNSIRLQNEDLSGKLRRMEILFTRVNDELARYRTAEGRSPFLNFDEETRLQKKLQETEENRLQLAETVIGLCTGIMQAAGIQRASRDLDPSAAMIALQHLEDRLESLERELSDCKLKARIAVEKRRLSDLRDFHTPVKAICGTTNFTANQQLPSPVSSSR
ncbi:unnamed protein product [Calypogeia fissa]